MTATTNCGARMQIAMTTVAHWGAAVVRDPAMIGSMAAFESWNSTMAEAKISNGPLLARPANASDHAPPSRLRAPPRARSGSMSADRICANATSVGTPNAVVRKNIAWFDNNKQRSH